MKFQEMFATFVYTIVFHSTVVNTITTTPANAQLSSSTFVSTLSYSLPNSTLSPAIESDECGYVVPANVNVTTHLSIGDGYANLYRVFYDLDESIDEKTMNSSINMTSADIHHVYTPASQWITTRVWPLAAENDTAYMNAIRVHALAYKPVIDVQIPRYLAKDSTQTINLLGLVDSDLATCDDVEIGISLDVGAKSWVGFDSITPEIMFDIPIGQYNASIYYVNPFTQVGYVNVAVFDVVGEMANFSMELLGVTLADGRFVENITHSCDLPVYARNANNTIRLSVTQGFPQKFELLIGERKVAVNVTGGEQSGVIYDFLEGIESASLVDNETNSTATTFNISATVTSYATDIPSLNIVEKIYAPIVDPIITPEPITYDTMVNDPLLITIKGSPPFINRIDTQECISGSYNFHIDDTVFVGSNNVSAEPILTRAGFYDLFMSYSNIFGDWSNTTSATSGKLIQVHEYLSGINLTILVKYLNSSEYIVTEAVETSQCGMVVGRDANNTIQVSVTTGAPSSYIILIGNTVHNLSVTNTTDPATYSMQLTDPFNSINLTSLSVTIKPAAPGDSQHQIIQDITPITVQPTLEALFDPKVVFVDQNVTIDFLNGNTSLKTVDLLECAGGILSVRVGPFLTIGIDETGITQVSFPDEGRYYVEVFYTNIFTSVMWNSSEHILVVKELKDLSFQLTNVTLTNGSVFPPPPLQDQCEIIGGKGIENYFQVSIAEGLVSNYMTTVDNRTYNLTNLGSHNFTTFTDTLVDSQSPDGLIDIGIQANPVSEADTKMILVDTIQAVTSDASQGSFSFNLTPDQIGYLTGDQIVFSFAAQSPFEETDFGDCSTGNVAVQVGERVFVGLGYNDTFIVTLDTVGEFDLDFVYTNYFTKSVVKTGRTLIVTDPLVGFAINVLTPYVANGTNNTIGLINTGIDQCPSVVGREVNNQIQLSVIQGIVSHYEVKIGDNIFNITPANSTNSNLTFTNNFRGSNISAISVRAVPASPVDMAQIVVELLYPVLADATNVNVVLGFDPDQPIHFTKEPIKITYNSTLPLQDEDFGDCADGDMVVHIGPKIYLGMGKSEQNIVNKFNTPGNYSIKFYYKNRYIEKPIEWTRDIWVVDRVLNFTWSAEVPIKGSYEPAIQPRNPNCSLLLSRGVDNRFTFSVGQGAVSHYFFAAGNDCFHNLTAEAMNKSVLNDAMMCDNTTSFQIMVVPYYSADVEIVYVVEVDPIVGDATGVSVELSVDPDENVHFTDEPVTFSYIAQLPFKANDFDDCGEGELTLRIGPHIIVGLGFNEADLTLTFPDEGDYPTKFFYSNVYTEQSFLGNRNITVQDRVRDLTWTVHVPLKNGTLVEAIESDQEGCGMIVGRNVDNILHASVAAGAVDYYQFVTGDTLRNLSSLNAANFTQFNDSLLGDNVTTIGLTVVPVTKRDREIIMIYDVNRVIVDASTGSVNVAMDPQWEYYFINEPIILFLNAQPEFLPDDFTHCAQGTFAMDAGPNIVTWSKYSEAISLTFPQMGNFPISFWYENVYTRQFISTADEIKIGERINGLEVNYEIILANGTNTTPPDTGNTSCGTVLARDSTNIISLHVARGLVSHYQVSVGDDIFNVTTSDQNATSFNRTFSGLNITSFAVMAIPHHPADWIIVAVESIDPIITDFSDAPHSLGAILSPDYPIFLHGETTNITYNYTQPFRNVDFGPCANYHLDVEIAAEAVTITYPTVSENHVLPMTTVGSFPVNMTYGNYFGGFATITNKMVRVVPHLAGLNLSAEVPLANGSTVPAVISGNESCGLVVGRSVNNIINIWVTEGLVNSYNVTIGSRTAEELFPLSNEAINSTAMMIEEFANNTDRNIFIHAEPYIDRDNSLSMNMTVTPVLTEVNFNVTVSPLQVKYLVDTRVTISYTADPPLQEVYMGSCSNFKLSVKIGTNITHDFMSITETEFTATLIDTGPSDDFHQIDMFHDNWFVNKVQKNITSPLWVVTPLDPSTLHINGSKQVRTGVNGLYYVLDTIQRTDGTPVAFNDLIFTWNDGTNNTHNRTGDQSSISVVYYEDLEYNMNVTVFDGLTEIQAWFSVVAYCTPSNYTVDSIYFPYNGTNTIDKPWLMSPSANYSILAGKEAHLFVSTHYNGVKRCSGIWMSISNDTEMYVSTEEVDYATAKQDCVDFGGTLASTRDIEKRWKMDVVRFAHGDQTKKMWIGLNRKEMGTPWMLQSDEKELLPCHDSWKDKCVHTNHLVAALEPSNENEPPKYVPHAKEEKFQYICERNSKKAFKATVSDSSNAETTEMPFKITINDPTTEKELLVNVKIEEMNLAGLGSDLVENIKLKVRDKMTETIDAEWKHIDSKNKPTTFVVGSPYNNWKLPLLYKYEFTLVNSNGTWPEIFETSEPEFTKVFSQEGNYTFRLTITDSTSEVVIEGKFEIVPLKGIGMNISFIWNSDTVDDTLISSKPLNKSSANGTIGWIPPIRLIPDKLLVLAEHEIRFTVTYYTGCVPNHTFSVFNNETDVANKTANFTIPCIDEKVDYNNKTWHHNTTLEPGEYTVTIQETHSVDPLNESITLIAIPRVPALIIKSPPHPIGNAWESIKFELMTTYTPSEYGCLYIEMGDKVTNKWGSDVCNYTKKFPEIKKKEPIAETFDHGMTFEHTYGAPGYKTMSALLYNFVSQTDFPLTFEIGDKTCFRPEITIMDSKQRTSQDSGSPVKLQCGEDHQLYVSMKLNCTMKATTITQWSAENVNHKSLMLRGMINLSKFGIEDTTKMQIELPKWFNCFNLMKISFKATMNLTEDKDDTRDISSTTFSYFQMIPSKIEAILFSSKTTQVTIGTDGSQQITLEPEKYSTNPNIEDDAIKFFDKYEYFCRLAKNDEWKLTKGKITLVKSPFYPSLDAEVVKGCFGEAGPVQMDFHTGKVVIRGKWFKHKHTYEIGVQITNNYLVAGMDEPKTSAAFVKIEVIKGSPPLVGIKCSRPERCLSTGYVVRVSKNTDTTLKCECENCGSKALEYKWNVIEWSIFGTNETITEEKRQEEMDGLDRNTLTFTPKLWSSDPLGFVDSYEFDCKITVIETNISAKAVLQVVGNIPPNDNDGLCKLEPKTGTAVTTSFQISCSGFKDVDDDDKITYNIIFKNNQQNGITSVYRGPLSSADFMLPAGTNTFTVTISDPLNDKVEAYVPQAIVENVPTANLDVKNLSPAAVSALVNIITNIESDDADLLSKCSSPNAVQLSTSKIETSQINNSADPFNIPEIVDSETANEEETNSQCPSGDAVLQRELGINTHNLDPQPLFSPPIESIEMLPDASKKNDSSTGKVDSAIAQRLNTQMMNMINPSEGEQQSLSSATITEALSVYNIKPPKDGVPYKAVLFPQKVSQPNVFASADPFAVISEPIPPVLGILMIREDRNRAFEMHKLTETTPTNLTIFNFASGEFEPGKVLTTTSAGDLTMNIDGMVQIGELEPMTIEAAKSFLKLTSEQQKLIADGKIPAIPSDEVVGYVIMDFPDGTAASVGLKKDTAVVKTIQLTEKEPKEGSITLPVQISNSGIVSVDPNHLFNNESVSFAHLLPGASKWLEFGDIAAAIKKLDTIIIPMSVQGCDSVKVAGERTAAYVGCLTQLKKQTDLINNAVADFNDILFEKLTSVPVTAENAKSQLASLQAFVASTITTTIDIETGTVVPQSTITLKTTEGAIARIEEVSEKINGDTDFFKTLSPEVGKEMGKQILKTTTTIMDALELAKTSPLQKDQEQAYERFIQYYETTIPKDPDKMIYVEDKTKEEIAMEEAKRNAIEQASKISARFKAVLETVTKLSILDTSSLERGEMIETELSDGGARMALKLGKPSQVLSRYIGHLETDNYVIKFPSDPCKMITKGNCDDKQIVRLMIIYYPVNFREMQSTNIPTTNMGLLDAKFTDIEGKEIVVKELNETIQFIFKGKLLPKMEQVTVFPENLMAKQALLNVHKIDVFRSNTSLIVQIEPNDPDVKLRLYYSRTYPGPYEDQYTSRTEELIEKKFNWWLPRETLAGFEGNVYIGVARIMPEGTEVDGNITIKLGDTIFSRNFTDGYQFRVIQKGCYYMNDYNEQWMSNGVETVEELSPKYLKCLTNHLTAFSAGLFTPPNVLDFDYVFSHAHFRNNLTIYFTLLMILLIFALLLIWATWADSEDKIKIGSMPLKDNDTPDKYIYEIITFTEHTRGSATDSKVSFVLSGDRGETRTRDFQSNIQDKKSFRNGALDSWIMSTKRPLGKLLYLRIWHDNSGRGAFKNWYLGKVIVIDCQTGERYVFMLDRWLAVDEDDGLIERMIPVSGQLKLTEFNVLFHERSGRKMADGHLWFSMFACPPQSRFTRTQRCSCCLVFVMTSMLASALYYGKVDEPSANMFKMGPFALSFEQIAVGMITNLIVFPITLLFIHLFRKARLTTKRPSRVLTGLKRDHQKVPPLTVNPPMRRQKPGCCMSLLSGSIPWFWRPIAWLLLISTVLACTFFVFSFGITFGDEKCRKWLTSMFVSLFSSLLIVQPVKIVCLILCCSCLCSDSDYDEEDYEENEESFYVRSDEEYVTGGQYGYQPNLDLLMTNIDKMEEIRLERMREKKVSEIFRELTIYVIFIIVVLVVAYGGRDSTSFKYTEELRNMFVGKWQKRNKTDRFTDVRNATAFYEWASNTLMAGVRATWYNGQPPIDMRGFINDKTSRIIGHALIRQVRSKDQTHCKLHKDVKHLFHGCNRDMSMSTEDDTNYGPKWYKLGADVSIRDEYKYRSASEFKGLPLYGRLSTYSSGGYFLHLFNYTNDTIKHFQLLLEEGWIDNRTRAVIVEFSLYNAFINTFASCWLMLETTRTGAFLPFYSFQPVRLYRYLDRFGIVLLACELIFCIYVLIFVAKETVKLKRFGFREYFTQFWTYLELLTILCAVLAVGFYIFRTVETNHISSEVDESNGNYYVKIQFAAWLDEGFNYLLGAILFLANVKVIQFLRYNERLGLLVDTVRLSSKEIFAFTVTFALVYMAFCSAFYLLLSMKLVEFSDMLLVAEEAFAAMLGKFSFRDILRSSWLAPWFFFLFMICQAMILINMLITIVTNMYLEVKTDVNKRGEDLAIANIMFAKTKMALGKNPSNTRVIHMVDTRADFTAMMAFNQRCNKLVSMLNKTYLGGAINMRAFERIARKRAATINRQHQEEWRNEEEANKQAFLRIKAMKEKRKENTLAPPVQKGSKKTLEKKK